MNNVIFGEDFTLFLRIFCTFLQFSIFSRKYLNSSPKYEQNHIPWNISILATPPLSLFYMHRMTIYSRSLFSTLACFLSMTAVFYSYFYFYDCELIVYFLYFVLVCSIRASCFVSLCRHNFSHSDVVSGIIGRFL